MKKSTKERILEASLQLFHKQGYHGVTIDQIVQQAGTSKGGSIITKNQKMSCFMKYMMFLFHMSSKKQKRHTFKLAHLLKNYQPSYILL